MPKDRPKDLLIIFCVSAFLLLAGLIMAVKYSGKPFLTENLSQLAQTADAGITRVLHVDANASSSDGDGSESRPFKTIQSAVNVATAGTKILVKAGIYNERVTIRNSGTSANPIVIEGTKNGGEYLSVMDGGTRFTNWEPAPEIGPQVYKVATPWAPFVITLGEFQLARLHDSEMTDVKVPSSSLDPAPTGHELMRSPVDYEVGFQGESDDEDAGGARKIKFWDVVYGIGGYKDGYTYVRLKDGSNPNNINLRLSRSGNAITAYAKSHVVVRNLKFRAYQSAMVFTDNSSYLTAEGNLIYNTRDGGIILTGGASNIILRDNEVTMKNYGVSPGAWGGADYESWLKEFLYLFYKYMMNHSSTGSHGIRTSTAGSDNQIYNNKVYGSLSGISMGSGSRLKIYGNQIYSHSSVGITQMPGCMQCEIYDNLIYDNNINIRPHELDSTPDRVVYIYNNRLYLKPGLGKHFHAHFNAGNPVPNPAPTNYIYNNSLAGGRYFFYPNASARNYGYLPNFYFINNIFSSETASLLTGAVRDNPSGIGAFDYNWIGGPAWSSSPAWYGPDNIKVNGGEIWDDSSLPNFVLPSGSTAFGAGVDLSKQQIINGKTIGPLPGMSSCPSGQSPHMGVFGCPGSSGGSTPVNGACSTVLNSCNAGSFSDTTDSATHHLWQCVGSNGGSTASCSLLKTDTVSSARIYVSPTGNDASPGSSSAPVATMERALALFNAQPSDGEIILRGGTYRISRSVKIAPSASNSKNLRIVAAAGEKPIFDGSADAVLTPLAGNPGIYLASGNFSVASIPEVWEESAKIRYEKVGDLNTLRNTDYGVTTYSTSALAVRPKNGIMPSAGDLKIAVVDYGFEITRSNVSVEGISFRGFGKSYAGAAVNIGFAAASMGLTDGTVVKNVFVENSYVAFYVGRGSIKSTIQNCETRDVAAGVRQWGGDIIVEYCRMINDDSPTSKFAFKNLDDSVLTARRGIRVHDSTMGGVFRYNVIKGFDIGIHVQSYMDGTKFLVEHNTVVSDRYYHNGDKTTTGLYLSRISTDRVGEVIARFNIVDGFYIPAYTNRTKTTVDKNLFWNAVDNAGGESAIATFRTYKQGENIIDDPLFINRSGLDFSLRSGSPAVGVSTDGAPAGALGLGLETSAPPYLRVSKEDGSAFSGTTVINSASLPLKLYASGGKRIVRAKMTVLNSSNSSLVSESTVNYEPFLTTVLPATAGLYALEVSVQDEAGIWSNKARILLDKKPASSGFEQSFYERANAHGFVTFIKNNQGVNQTIEYRRKGESSWTRGFSSSEYANSQNVPYDDGRTVSAKPLFATGLSSGAIYEYRVVAHGSSGDFYSSIFEITVSGAPRTFYVSSDGADASGRGDRTTPVRTLQYALDRVLPGDKIVLMPGLYIGTHVLMKGGLPDAPITIEGEDAKLSAIEGRREYNIGLYLSKTAHVVVRNLTVKFFKQEGIRCYKCESVEISRSILFNDVAANLASGIGISLVESQNTTITNNLVRSWLVGINAYYSPNTKIRHNTIVSNLEEGVAIQDGSWGSEITYNSINYTANHGMEIRMPPSGRDRLIVDYNNVGTTFQTTTRGSPPDSSLVKQYSHLPNSREMYLYYPRFGTSAESRFISSFSEWKSLTGFDVNSIFADPLWVDPLRDNYHLKPGSPNLLPDGKIIGAFGLESSGGTTPPQSGVNGVCGSGLNACISGNFFDTQDASTHYLWSCLGIGGGSSASCTLSKQAQVHGSCSATLNQCSAGTYSDLSDSSSEYRWYCIGLNGGNSAVCRSPIPGSAPTPPMSGQSNPDLRVSIEARPSSGEAPQEYVSVIATISGYISRTVDYYFYCNRPESSLGIVRPSDGYYGLSASKSQIHNCSYREPGEYTPKVIADFGNGSVAEARTTVVVLKPGSSTAGAGGSTSVYLSSAPRFGQSGEDVLKLQRLLARRGHLPENLTTGYFGSVTLQAVADFKRSANVTLGASDGIVDANTLKAINYFASLYPELSSGAPSASSGEGYLRSVLALGQRGSEVVKLQRFLIQAGYLSSDLATGYFGTLTSSAVRSFKARTNVPTSDRSSGNVDEATRKAINTEATKYPALLSPGSAGGPVSPSPNPASPAPAPLSGPIPAITSALSYGSEGAQVIALQRVLVKENLLSSSDVVGYFGTKTLKAVRDFQRKYSITTSLDPAYGMVGPKTRAKLNELR